MDISLVFGWSAVAVSSFQCQPVVYWQDNSNQLPNYATMYLPDKGSTHALQHSHSGQMEEYLFAAVVERDTVIGALLKY